MATYQNGKRTQGEKRRVSGVERRYKNARSKLRAIPRASLGKADQEDLAHIIHKVESYGFGFFPPHYLMDDIKQMERIVAENTNQPN